MISGVFQNLNQHGFTQQEDHLMDCTSIYFWYNLINFMVIQAKATIKVIHLHPLPQPQQQPYKMTSTITSTTTLQMTTCHLLVKAYVI
jgi:hypothetical protein